MGFVNSPDFQAQKETPAVAGKCPLHVVTTPEGEHRGKVHLIQWEEASREKHTRGYTGTVIIVWQIQLLHSQVGIGQFWADNSCSP